MIRKACVALLGWSLAGGVWAQDSDLADGGELYVSQCQICHGSVEQSTTAGWAPLLVAMDASRSPLSDAADKRLAFAPPFGPNLRGVVGRIAGTAPGFTYSSTFMKTLKGMEWNEAALNVWITSPQAWVPGVYMFYKQPDPEIRRKIILYLKAHS